MLVVGCCSCVCSFLYVCCCLSVGDFGLPLLLFVVHGLLFVVCCSLFVVRCLSLVVCCLLFVCFCLFVVSCLLLIVSR